jgi:CRISPR/Cas system-associated exonuclease Cas4 (RecB family)
VPNFNRANISESPICLEINRLLEAAAARMPEANNRRYLGASAIGSECLRRVQYDWMCDASHPLRLRDIFRRGHVFEALTRQHLIAAGFRFAPDGKALSFSTAGGLFRGHCDGIVVGGPKLPGVGFPCLWEHKCLGSKGWRAIEREGLEKEYPHYLAQVLIYQAYLNLTDHSAIFTATNADSCERLHLLVPFDAARAQEWSDRAATVIEATRAGELLPRVTDDPQDWRCKMCGHRERCWRQR